MPRFCANLTWLFTELPMEERIRAAADAGFKGVEILFPYDHSAPALRSWLDEAHLELVLINAPPPNYTGGSPGYAAVPGSEVRFRQDFLRSLRFAQALGARNLHVMSGVAEGRAARDCFVENLIWAADHAHGEARGLTLTIEPINPVDMPGYFMNNFDLALEIIEEVEAPNLWLQFDAYHAHRLTGDVFRTWAGVSDLVSHVQIAGYPGRHEPDGGEIDYPAFFAMLDAGGYRGWVSGEYRPRTETGAGLGWLRHRP